MGTILGGAISALKGGASVGSSATASGGSAFSGLLPETPAGKIMGGGFGAEGLTIFQGMATTLSEISATLTSMQGSFGMGGDAKGDSAAGELTKGLTSKKGKKGIKGMSGMFKGLMKSAGPIGMLISVITGLLALVAPLMSLGSILGILSTLVSLGFMDMANDLMVGIIAFIPLAQTLGEWISEIYAGIKELMMTGDSKKLEEVFSKILKSIVSFFQSVDWPAVLKRMVPILKFLFFGGIQILYALLKTLNSLYGAQAKSWALGVWAKVVDWFSKAWVWLVSSIRNAIMRVIRFFTEDLPEAIFKAFDDLVNRVRNSMAEGWENTTDAIAEAGENAASTWDSWFS